MLCELFRNVFFQDVADGKRDYDAVLLFKITVNFPQCVTSVIKGNKESLFTLRPTHGRFKCVYVWPANPILLLHLHRIKAFIQGQFVSSSFAPIVQSRHWENPSVNSFVTDLNFVLSAAKRNHRPILKFKRWNSS